jgi:hypothetical protein
MTAPIRTAAVLLLSLGLSAGAAAQALSTSQTPATRAHVEALASEELGGREAGSPGERMAAEYLSDTLAGLGARPLPGLGSMLVPFEFTAGSRDGGTRLSIGERAFAARDDVLALAFSDDATISGEAVFAGYGIVVPDAQDFGYDSYAGLDVEGKVVVVLRYYPEDADRETRAILARYSGLRFKAMAARQRGAAGLIVVTGPRSPNAGETVPMTFDTALAGSGIAAASVSGEVADVLFAGTRSLEAAQQELDTGNPHVAGFPLETGRVELATRVERVTQTAHNVVAYLPATGGISGVDKPWVALGAHYDHLGLGQRGTSLAAGDEVGLPHLGADDNASGTAAVLAAAGTLARAPLRRRHVLLAFWSAEEIGLIGSKAFLDAAVVPPDRIAAYLNFDMVGRMQDNRLAVQATGTSPVWASILERANVPAGFDLTLQADPYQPTDVTNFAQASIPSLNFTTGAHLDYHKPSDTADKIVYADLDRVAAFAAAIAARLVGLEEAPAYVHVEEATDTANRAGLRVFTGTVPDYTSEVDGLRLSGVIGGGPAERAGLREGDVIVEIAGQSIANIYDYTYALELLTVGEPVTVAFLRDGARQTVTLTPDARR